MGTNSACPDDLDAFSAGSREADARLERAHGALQAALDEFAEGTSWAAFDAALLMRALGSYTRANGEDARWTAQIASRFRSAGGDGSLPLPDAAIEASLRAAHLDHERVPVDVVDPVVFGAQETSGYADDPVNTALGNFVEVETELLFPPLLQKLTLERTYNSRSDRDGPFGPRWSCWASTRLVAGPDGAEYEGPDGRRATFPRTGAGFGRVVGVNALVERVGAELALAWFGGERWLFDPAGRLSSVAHGPGTEVRFDHDGEGRLVAIRHIRGREVALRWEGGRIVGLSSSDGREATYRYDEHGNLVEAEGVAGVRRYTLDDAGLIASVTDADGVVELVNTYDEHGRVLTQLSPFGRRTIFSYLPGNVTVTSDDSGGRTNTFVHDRAGRLLAAVDGHEQKLRKNYDDWGNPVAIVDRNGAVTLQEWDDRARLVRRTLPSGVAFDFGYDEADRLVSVTASSQHRVEYRYDGAERIPSAVMLPTGATMLLTVGDGLVHAVTDPDSVTTRFRYDDFGDLVGVTDGLGATTRIERDRSGRVAAVTTPTGRRTEFHYDRRGLRTRRFDPGGGTWSYGYSAVGRLTAVEDALGCRTEFRYGPAGRAIAVVDPLGHETTARYDATGNLVEIRTPDQASWSYGYDELSRLVSAIDPLGATWRQAHDVEGNLTGVVGPTGVRHAVGASAIPPSWPVMLSPPDGTSPDNDLQLWAGGPRPATPDVRLPPVPDLGGPRTVLEGQPDHPSRAPAFAVLDSVGLPVPSARVGAAHPGPADPGMDPPTPDGSTSRTERTAGGRIRRRITSAGRTETFTYDACGRLETWTDGGGRRWTQHHDADGAVVEQIGPDGRTDTFSYDAAGRLVGRARSGRVVWSCTRDALGRVTTETTPLSGTRRFDHDATGRVTAVVDANGGVHRYSYDSRGRVTTIVDPMGGRTVLGYDDVGRLLSRTDPLGRTTSYAYDPAGLLVAVTDPTGARIRWSHDRDGRASAVTWASTDGVMVERDAVGRPVRIDECGREPLELRWDRSGQLVERRRGERVTTWSYDADGACVGIRYPDGRRLTVARDGAGRVTGLEHPLLGRLRAERDSAGRLVRVTADGLVMAWTYEDGDLTGYAVECAGEWRHTRVVRDTAGRVVEVVTDGVPTRFTYDAAGQLTAASGPDGTRSFTYDANGRLVREEGASSRTYTYDAAGQLIAAGEQSFAYDGAGRRTMETGPAGRRSYRWDSLGRLSGIDVETTDSGARSIELCVDATGELTAVDGIPLTWDAVDPVAPLIGIGPDLVIGDRRPWARVTPRAADDPWLMPDWRGSVGPPTTDPWGAAGDDLGLGYRGELVVGGAVWLRNRAYDPRTRAFLSPDPLAAVPGAPYSANPYHYAGNDPVNAGDPSGLRPLSDRDLQALRDQSGRGAWDTVVDWVRDNGSVIASLGARSVVDAARSLVGEVGDVVGGAGAPFSAIDWAGAAVAVLTGGDRAPSGSSDVSPPRDAGAGPPTEPGALADHWRDVALTKAGIDPADWDPNRGARQLRDIIEKAYTYYGDLFLQNPYFQWAGMANMIGPSFAAGFFDLDQIRRAARLLEKAPNAPGGMSVLASASDGDLKFYETTLLRMQQKIFYDIASMHEAYLSGGMAAIYELAKAVSLDPETVKSWEDIDEGRRTGNAELIAKGNLGLLYREQHDIIQGDYDRMRGHPVTGEAFTYLMTAVGEPSIRDARSFGDYRPFSVVRESPGVRRIPWVGWDNPLQVEVEVETPFPDGNLADFGDRWDYILDDTLPAYQQLLRDDEARSIVETPVDERIDESRLVNRLDSLAEQYATDWDVDVRQ